MFISLMAEDGAADPAVTARTAGYRTRVRDALRDALKRAVVRADLLFGEVLAINVAAREGRAPTTIDGSLGRRGTPR